MRGKISRAIGQSPEPWDNFLRDGKISQPTGKSPARWENLAGGGRISSPWEIIRSGGKMCEGGDAQVNSIPRLPRTLPDYVDSFPSNVKGLFVKCALNSLRSATPLCVKSTLFSPNTFGGFVSKRSHSEAGGGNVIGNPGLRDVPAK